MKMDLLELIKIYGKENILFITPLRPLRKILFLTYVSGNDPETDIPCKINEDRYKLKDNYKITLEPIYPEFETRHFYISDLENLIREGHIKVFVDRSKDI